MKRFGSLFVLLLPVILWIGATNSVRGQAFITEIIDSVGDGDGESGNFLTGPLDVVGDASGNIFTAGRGTNNAFKIAPDGTITQIIDARGDGLGNTLDKPEGMAVDGFGNVYVTGTTSDNVFKITPAGVVTQIIDATGDGLGSTLDYPNSLAVDIFGNIFVTGNLVDKVFKITPGGVITVIIDPAGDGLGNILDAPYAIQVDPAGNVFVVGSFSHNAFKITPAGVITVIIDAAGDGAGKTLDSPFGLAVDNAGNVYVSGSKSHNAFEISTSGVITEIIDSGGDNFGNVLTNPEGLAVDDAGTVFLAGQSSHNVFRIPVTGIITEMVDGLGDGSENLTLPTELAFDASGHLYVTGFASDNVLQIIPSQAEIDRDALVALYNSTNGPNWTDNTNWLTNSPLFTWAGVSAFFDEEIGDNIVWEIDLRRNGLSGNLPSEWQDLIVLDGALSGLLILDLGDNDIAGVIPPSLGDLPALIELHLHRNRIVGPIPRELGNLENLRILALNENNLNGPIPPSLNSLTNLTRLSLFVNLLTGEIPDLSALTQLTSFGLGENLLGGPVPATLGSNLSLAFLDLNNNIFTTIPSEIGNLTNLIDLRLNGNDIPSIPESFKLLINVEDLRLDDNMISSLPDLSGLSDLTNFPVENNFLDFGDLEPNASIFAITYSPQGLVGAFQFVDVFIGGNVTLDVPVGGTFNLYQWSLNGFPIPGAIGPTYEIVNASAADAGIYTLEITNTVVSQLILTSETITVTVSPLPTISIVTPNGGEIWAQGFTHQIVWTSENVTGFVDIDLLKQGSLERNLGSSDVGEGSFVWVIPFDVSPGSDYKIRVGHVEGDVPGLNLGKTNDGKTGEISEFNNIQGHVFGESESEFTINAPPDPVLVVTRPNGGEMFTLLTTESISWTSQNAPGPVIIELYRGGSLSRVIASSATNNGLFSWIIPGDVTPGTDYKIRVTSASDGDIFGESNSPFTIAAPLDPALTVTRPDGGELWSLLTTEQIRWSSQDISGLVDIELWKGGVFNRALDAGSADDGVFDWLIAGDIPPGSDFTVRVISTDDSDVFGESVAPFTLVAPPDPVIAITRPNGGESWTVLTTEQIQWSSQDVSGLLIIELWKGGVLNRRLGANETNDGTFNWQIPDDLAPAFDYKIKIISVTDPSVFDESDAPFTVIDPPADPSLTIVRPNGGETWLVLTSESIVWASQDILGLVDIELRRAGFPERVIVTGIADTGVFQWSIPNDVSPGDDYTIRVLSVDDPAVFDESDAPFFITDPGSNEIVVTEPDDILAVAGSDIPVQAELPAGYNPEIREVCFRRAGENVYRCDAMSVSGTTNTAIIPGSFVTERGVDYFYRFVRDAVERTVPSTNASFMPFRVTVPVSAITSPIVIVGRTYSMISVPVVLEDPRVTSVLPGLGNPAVERLLRWNSSADSYEEAPDISSDFSPGNAFWYISSFADEFEVTGARSVDPSQPFDITLPPGFSQIGNPFAFPVAWTDVLGSSAVDFPVSFDASLGENDPYRYNVSIIDPWEGYWVNNPLSESVVIRVRPVEAPPGAASKNASVSALALSAQYVVQLNAALPAYSLRDSQNYLGLADGATDGHDAIDFAEAPGLGNHVRLSIIQDDVRLAGSFKNTTSAGQEWRLEISAELPREFSEQGEYVYVTLTEEGVLPAGFSLFVIDDDNAERIPLIESSFAVIISADYPVRNLRLIVGTDSYASKRSNGVTETPQSIGLEQNYPNPFSSETRIRYQLSKRTLVRLEVFNVLGQRVASLVNQSQDAGWYLTDWDGTDETGRPVASGTYFYRFVTDVITDTKSMVIIR